MPDMTSLRNKTIVGTIIIILVLALGIGGLLRYQYHRQQSLLNGKISGNKLAVENQPKVGADLQSVTQVRPLDQSDYVQGSLQAPVQIIFYGDFDCPFCADFYSTLKKAETEFKDNVAIGWRYFPLRIHDMALSAAEAAECAAEQGKFWEMYDKLFTDKQNNKLNTDQIATDAVAVGLDAKQFKNCWDGGKYRDKIQSQLQEASKYNVSGPPYSFINGAYISGAKPWDDYKDQNGNTQTGLKSIINGILQAK